MADFRIQLRRKTNATIGTPKDAELTHVTDQDRMVLGDGSTSGGKYAVVLVPLSGMAAGDIVQYDGTKFIRIARQAAVADVVDSGLPANGTIGSLSFSSTPTQAEVEALRDECENLRDALANAITTIEQLRDRFEATGGNGLLADA